MTTDRRDLLKLVAAAGAAGLPALPLSATDAAQAAGASSYNPTATFELAVSEVELRRNRAGRMLMARIYQPKGAGPFPTVLDLHGGAWNRKDRLAEEPMDRALAASGVLVVAIDLTLAPEAPYPASVQDANYGVRWLKAKAAAGTATPRSSASTAARAAATSPSSWRCARAIRATTRFPLAGAPNVDATVAYVAMRSPISDPFARYENAERRTEREHDHRATRCSSFRGRRSTRQPAGDARARGEGHAGADPDHAGCARRQRAAGDAGEIREDLPRRRRRAASIACSRIRSTNGSPIRGRRPTRRTRLPRSSSPGSLKA